VAAQTKTLAPFANLTCRQKGVAEGSESVDAGCRATKRRSSAQMSRGFACKRPEPAVPFREDAYRSAPRLHTRGTWACRPVFWL